MSKSFPDLQVIKQNPNPHHFFPCAGAGHFCTESARFHVVYTRNDWKNLCIYHATVLCRSLGMPDPVLSEEDQADWRRHPA
jgi:hypothetical protein